MNGVLQKMLLGKLNQRRGEGRDVGCASEGHEFRTKSQSQNLRAETTVETYTIKLRLFSKSQKI